MDQKLKQRLVGAVVLVSLAVIFIPIILEGPDDEWTPRTQGMPKAPTIDYRAQVEVPVAEPAPQPQPRPALPEPVAEAAGTPEPPAADPEPVDPQPASAPAVEAPAADIPADAWIIQVGSFSLQPNAQGLRDRLRRAGFAASLQEVKTGNGKRTYRVQVGPVSDRAAADSLRERLVREQQLEGLVIQGGG